MMRKTAQVLIAASACLTASTCTTARTTHTPRTGQEQLLVSTAVDRALDRADFSPFSGRRVFLEER